MVEALGSERVNILDSCPFKSSVPVLLRWAPIQPRWPPVSHAWRRRRPASVQLWSTSIPMTQRWARPSYGGSVVSRAQRP